VVYVSGTLSLAMLELFVHLDTVARNTLRLVAIPVSIPDKLVEAIGTPPKGWRTEPPPKQTRDLGTDWARAGPSCVLQVPSVIVPEESSFVVNPAHADFRHIQIGSERPVSFDARLWK